MPNIPKAVLSIVDAYLDSLLLWFSDYVYTELLKRAQDHVLVKLQTHLDFTALEKACADYHHRTGPGAPPTHTVPQLVRALLVKYLFNWSWRQLEFQIRFNLIVKCFVGYPIFAAGPDHTTLERFDVWVCKHQHRTFFDDILCQIDAHFPEDRDQPQIGDTFAMQANAAPESLVRLIRHTCQRMLGDLASVDPVHHAAVVAQLDMNVLFGTPDEVSEYRLDRAGRRARLQTTVSAALQCAESVRAQSTSLSTEARLAIATQLDCLDKILADEVHIERDSANQDIHVTELPKEQKGSYRIASATDSDATYRVHGENKVDLGYNVNVAATTRFIREIRADTGAQPDSVGVPKVLDAQIEHHDLAPSKFIYDAAAGTGKARFRVARVTEGQTQLVAPLIPYDERADRYTPTDFTLSGDGSGLTCPNGQTSSTAYRSGSGDGRNFRFSAHQCAGCPLWEQCRDPEANPGGMRQVFISDYRPLLDVARAYNQTDDFKADMKLRPIIEQIIAGLTRYNGARRARGRGNDKVDFQAKMSATAFNIKRWMSLLDPVAIT